VRVYFVGDGERGARPTAALVFLHTTHSLQEREQLELMKGKEGAATLASPPPPPRFPAPRALRLIYRRTKNTGA
jgi:hypothetical protein